MNMALKCDSWSRVIVLLKLAYHDVGDLGPDDACMYPASAAKGAGFENQGVVIMLPPYHR